MRSVSAQIQQLIEDLSSAAGGGLQAQWVADLMYDGDRRQQNLLITDVDLQWDASSFVVGSGSVRVVWADDFGSTMIPAQLGDWFSPFGAELQIDCLVGAGSFTERIPMGRFVIEEVPDTVEASLLHQGILIHPGESFTVNLRDRLMRPYRDKFVAPQAPSSTSAWQEAQSITGLPVVRTVDDATVASSVTYDGSRSDALTAIFDLMGAWPRVDANGALTGSSKAWTDPVGEVRGVISAPVTMTAEYTYNRVVVEGKNSDGDAIYATTAVQEGFLRVTNTDGSVSPFGGKTYSYSSDMLTTYEQCAAYAADLLPRVSRLRSVTRDIVEPFNPLREVDDVLTSDFGLVRITKLAHKGGQTTMTVDVGDSDEL